MCVFDKISRTLINPSIQLPKRSLLFFQIVKVYQVIMSILSSPLSYILPLISFSSRNSSVIMLPSFPLVITKLFVKAQERYYVGIMFYQRIRICLEIKKTSENHGGFPCLKIRSFNYLQGQNLIEKGSLPTRNRQ